MTNLNTPARDASLCAQKPSSFNALSFEHARDLLVGWLEKAEKTLTPLKSDELEAIGLTFVDHGNYANTFITPCGRFILKVNHTYDEAYAKFIDVALRRQDNPHYPQIYFAGKHTAFQVVLMEMLEPLHEDSPLLGLSEYLQKQVCFGQMPREVEGSDAFVKLVWDMYSLMQQDGVTEDLCGRNIMVRAANGTQVLVVTDPVSPGSCSW